MTVKEALGYTEKRLIAVTDEAVNESKILIAHLLDEPVGGLLFSQKEVDAERLLECIEKRLQNVPLQYIIGKWWFYKGEFFVGDGVLIPRQDTETLVEVANELLKGKRDASVCDLCAGSGCIGISIAEDFPDIEVTCVEKYDKAFGYLERNIRHNGVKNVTAEKADVLTCVFGQYDLIVSNPPYITAEDMKKLSPEVKNEPETALFGGEDGLYFYREITRLWRSALKVSGILAFEVGIGEADAVVGILRENGFDNITVRKDLCGVQRVVFGTVDNI